MKTATRDFPLMLSTIKVVGGLYLMHVAVGLWRNTLQLSNAAREIRRRELFLATLSNPKALLFALVLFPVQTWQGLLPYVGVMSAFVMVVAIMGALWIAFGALLMQDGLRVIKPRTFQRVAALALCGFAVWLAWDALHA